MRGFLQLIVTNPVAVVLLVVVAVLGGVFALFHLPVGLFPELDAPVVNIIGHYPGAAAEDIEILITRPIEDRIRTLPGIRRVASTSGEGLSMITAQFAWGASLTDAHQLVQTQVSSVQSELPAGVRPRLENIGTTLQEVVGYVVYGGGNSIDLRTTVQQELAGRLMDVDGVLRVEVLGGDQPAFLVDVRPEALVRERLTISDVIGVLAEHNLAMAAGYIDRGSREYVMRGDNRLQTISQVEAVPVISDGTRSVLLRDIASVRLGAAPRHYQVHGNGRSAVAFLVSKQPHASTIAVVRGVEAELARTRALLPAGAQVRKFYDQADIILEARRSLFHDLVVGALLAAAVLFFFVGTVRAALIVTATIPIALLLTLALMQGFGQTLNVITLSALTLVVGMVLDDAIVVSESIIRHLQSGQERRTAGLTGAAEIAGPDASGTFTTVAAFAPLLFLGGIAGLFVRPFGLVVSVALLSSLLISLTFVPVMFSWVGATARPGAFGAGFLRRLDRALQRILQWAFRHRGFTILLGVLALCLGGLAVRLGPVRVLPPVDEGALLIEYVMPPGTSLQESGRIGDILERWAMGRPDIETVYRRTGSPEEGLQVEGVNRGELTMRLTPRSGRRRTLEQVMDSLRQEYDKIPGVVFLYHQPTQEKMDESLSGLPAAFGVTIFGPDENELVSLAARIERIMVEDPALGNIINNTKVRTPQIVIQPNPVELACCGLSPRTIFDTVQAGRFGALATTVIRRRTQVQVLVRLQPPRDATLTWLRGLALPTSQGQRVPLSQVADIHVIHRPAAITRLNGQREVTILAEVSGSIPATVDRLRRAFASVRLPDGYSIAFTGQYQVIGKTTLDFVMTGLAAVSLIYLIMTMQFGSWLQPLIVLITVPLALVGAIVLLAATRVGVDVSVGMGALTLIGIAVNNAIVLVDYANRQVAAGRPVRAALSTAVSVRLRPILMTAATTIFALIPVAVNPAAGSRIFQPFAITVIGGLLSTGAATLVLVPVLVPEHGKARAGATS